MRCPRRKYTFPALFLLCLLAFAGTSFPQEAVPTKAEASKQVTEGIPVVVNGKALFEVHSRLFTFSAEDRASAIARKVNWLSKQPEGEIRALTVVDEGNFSEIASGDTILMTVTDSDAKVAGESRQALAQHLAERIRAAAYALREDTSIKRLLLEALYALLATVVLVVAFKLLGFAFRKLYAKLNSWYGIYIRSIRIQKLELFTAERILQLLLLISRVLRAAVSLTLVYAYLTVVLNFFPWTRGYASLLFQYVLSPLRALWQAVTAYLPNVFFVVVILVVAIYVVKFAKFVFREVGQGNITFPGFYPEWAEPTYKITRFLILAFTAVVVFPYLPGAKSPAFQGVSIFLGLLLSLGSSSAVSNVVAGSVLTYTRAFQLGDRVKIGDAIGDVTEKTLLVTRIRTIKNVNIAIPNATVLSSHIINFGASDGEENLILNTSVTIGYDAPWRKVHELLIAAALATEDILKEPKPFVYQTSLDDFYVSYELNAHTNKANQMARIYSDLHQNIQDKFNEAGVEIMSPHYESMRDGNSTTIPEACLPDGYQAPAFRVLQLGGMSTVEKSGSRE